LRVNMRSSVEPSERVVNMIVLFMVMGFDRTAGGRIAVGRDAGTPACSAHRTGPEKGSDHAGCGEPF